MDIRHICEQTYHLSSHCVASSKFEMITRCTIVIRMHILLCVQRKVHYL